MSPAHFITVLLLNKSYCVCDLVFVLEELTLFDTSRCDPKWEDRLTDRENKGPILTVKKVLKVAGYGPAL